MEFPKSKIVHKTWGHEEIIVNNDNYCGKLLVFNPNTNASLHYHVIKHETFYVSQGNFILKYINPDTAETLSKDLSVGEIVIIKPGLCHQLYSGSSGGVIVEFSTHDFPSDSYRISR